MGPSMGPFTFWCFLYFLFPFSFFHPPGFRFSPKILLLVESEISQSLSESSGFGISSTFQSSKLWRTPVYIRPAQIPLAFWTFPSPVTSKSGSLGNKPLKNLDFGIFEPSGSDSSSEENKPPDSFIDFLRLQFRARRLRESRLSVNGYKSYCVSHIRIWLLSSWVIWYESYHMTCVCDITRQNHWISSRHSLCHIGKVNYIYTGSSIAIFPRIHFECHIA